MNDDLVVVAVALVAWAAVSRRLRGSVLTPAMAFVALGWALGDRGAGWIELGADSETLLALAEATLALVLFGDATSLRTRVLAHELSLPVRLLAVGLPLTIAAGALLAVPVLGLGALDALVLAVLLAPTDAALGQAVVTDGRLPTRLRQGLNVESGLNDGICVPLLFTALALAEIGGTPSPDTEIVRELATEIGVAAVVGILAASLVGLVVVAADRRGWIDEAWRQVVPLATAAGTYAVADETGGSGFIAVFVAGLVYRRWVGAAAAHESTRLVEEVGGVLSAVTFLAFGSAFVGDAVADLDLAVVAYAVASLTVVRMAPVALALLGSGASRPTSLFAGWFGPRGLATIVFVVTVLDTTALGDLDTIVRAATITVLLSVVAHGVTAPGLTDRYVRWLGRRPSGGAVEEGAVEEGVVEEIARPGAPVAPRSAWFRPSRRSPAPGDAPRSSVPRGSSP